MKPAAKSRRVSNAAAPICAAALATFAMLTGCASTVVPFAADASIVTCALPSGGTCAAGASCPAGDGCNTCQCNATGQLACTHRGCVDASTAVCHTSRDCTTGQRCVYAPGCSVTLGTCQPDDHCDSLPTVGTFCGCDGGTIEIPSACTPERPYAHAGSCASADAGIVCHLDDGGVCNVGATCGMGPGVCDFYVCQPNGTLAIESPCNQPGPCRVDTDCPGGNVCEYTQGCGREGTTGTCQPARDCGGSVPLCGCDGMTFMSTCQPTRAFGSMGPCAGG